MSILNKFLAMHNALAVQDHMVYEVWEDGEITLTKGGDLYRMRGLHLIKGGDISKALPAESMPVRYGEHGCIQVMTSEQANEASDLILN
jgi:hypothetical protein